MRLVTLALCETQERAGLRIGNVNSKPDSLGYPLNKVIEPANALRNVQGDGLDTLAGDHASRAAPFGRFH